MLTCLLSFSSMPLFCAEENPAMEISRKRWQREDQRQDGRTKRVKRGQNQDPADTENMEIIPGIFSFGDLEKILNEIVGRKESCSLLELVNKKANALYLQEMEQANKQFFSLEKRLTEFQKMNNLQLSSTAEDGDSLISLGKEFQENGKENWGKELEEIGLITNFWKIRKSIALNRLVGAIFEDPQCEDLQLSDVD